MTDEADKTSTREAVQWAKACLDEACISVSRLGILEGITFDARVAWTLPKRIVIGQIRDTGPHQREFWIIAGEVPTDCIDASTSSTPRDAARHFALKWQLGAEQLRDPEERAKRPLKPVADWISTADDLERVAVELYTLAEEDRAWKSES
jgi:hypothetical protein